MAPLRFERRRVLAKFHRKKWCDRFCSICQFH
jgi:hypothetical protein